MYKEELQQTITDIFKTHFLVIITAGILINLYSTVLTVFLNEYVLILNTVVFSFISCCYYLKLAFRYDISIFDFFKHHHFNAKKIIAYSSLCFGIVNIGIIISFILILILTTLSLIYQLPVSNELAIVSSNSLNIKLLIIQLIRGCLIAPIFEEIAFRGVIFNILKKHGELVAIFFTSLFFAIVHGLDSSFVIRFISSIILIQVTINFHNLIPAMLLHSFMNFTITIYNAMIPLRNTTISMLALISIVLVYFFYQRKYYDDLNLNLKDFWQTIKQGVQETISLKVVICLVLFVLIL